MIQISGLSKSFATERFLRAAKRVVPAICDVNLNIAPGQCWAILGPNGSGKTTLLKIISTLILPDKGTVRVLGLEAGRDDLAIKSRIGLLAEEERGFYWRLSGRQNLEFFAALYGLKCREAKTRIETLFKQFGIDQPDRPFGTSSSGTKKKFALIRALLHQPEILILDEPTKSLDLKTAEELRALIKARVRDQQTVVMATHNLQEAESLGQRFLILARGRVRAQGTLEDLCRQSHVTEPDLTKVYMKVIGDET